ncbi:MAG: DUF6468 domain-containing protein [Methyloligellaceae bacterium]
MIFGYLIEIVVAILLVTTIGYCIIVNRKLENLRDNQKNLKSIVKQLHLATAQAEKAISSLKQTVTQSEQELALRIDEARAASDVLQKRIERGQGILEPQEFEPIVSQKSHGTKPSRPVSRETSTREKLWPHLNLQKLAAEGFSDPKEMKRKGSRS